MMQFRLMLYLDRKPVFSLLFVLTREGMDMYSDGDSCWSDLPILCGGKRNI